MTGIIKKVKKYDYYYMNLSRAYLSGTTMSPSQFIINIFHTRSILPLSLNIDTIIEIIILVWTEQKKKNIKN